MQLANRITVQQNQCLSIALRQSLNILEKTNCELKELIAAEHQSNPMLELNESTEISEPVVDIDVIGKWFEENSIPNPETGWVGEERPAFDLSDKKCGVTLHEYLEEQISLRGMSDSDYNDVRAIIYMLDSSGYLREDIDDICSLAGMCRERCLRAVNAVRELEPRGVGCRDLSEFLILQLKDADINDDNMFLVIRNYIEQLAMGEHNVIAKETGIPIKKLREYSKIIRGLRPRPASGFFEGNDAEFIVPDITVRGTPESYEITLNDKWMGSVGISSYYRSYMKMAGDSSAREYCRERLERAKWLLTCIEQRRNTLIAVAGEIVKMQADFLFGQGDLKPMNLRIIAESLKIHESTVSRAVKDKYIQTPKSVYALKGLFSWGVESYSDDKGRVSRQSVKGRIKEIVDAESPCDPRTDADIAAELEAMGMVISRRTVAKYREEMGILNRSERRAI